MTTSTYDRTAAPRTSTEVEALRRERVLVAKFRRQMVELLRLPYCTVCGGTTALVFRPDLLCVCAANAAEAEARVLAIVAERQAKRGRRGRSSS